VWSCKCRGPMCVARSRTSATHPHSIEWNLQPLRESFSGP
jgi:hypothetical protein